MARKLFAALRYGAFCGAIALVLLELVLQAGAWIMRPPGRDRVVDQPIAGDTLRIVCLGDSNTYGLWVEAEEAWPAVLERSWNESTALPKLQVINLAFPGTTSTRVLKNLTQVLDTFTPDYVLVMVGHNDFWSPPTVVDQPAPEPFAESWWYEHLRSYRLFYMLRQSRLGAPGSTAEPSSSRGSVGRRPFDPEKLRVDQSLRGLSADERRQLVDELVERRVELAKRIREGKPLDDLRQEIPTHLRKPIQYGDIDFDLGLSVEGNDSGRDPMDILYQSLRGFDGVPSQYPFQAIFLTYPSNVFIYHAANEAIRRFGRSTNRPWWDLTPHFLALCGSETTENCDEYFLSDQHPTPKGHEAAAEWIGAALRQRLAGTE